MKIDHLFNQEQLNLFSSLGYPITQKDYSDEELIELEDIIADKLSFNGFDDEYTPNNMGLICESILDIFGEM